MADSSTLNFQPKKDDDHVRHCAFCLILCEPSAIIKCSGCQKRAYCSEICQKKDCSVDGTGQRHNNWCGRHEYGEEDVDWEIVSVLNKGLGVRAKKLLPAGYRIIVEPVFTNPHDHPGIADLEPKESSLDDKFQLNSFSGHSVERDGDQNFLGLRTSRVNHSCWPNSSIYFDETARVRILLAQRDIEPGEEISVIYSHFYDFASMTPTVGSKEKLQYLKSIICAQCGIADIRKGPSSADIEFQMIDSVLRKQWGIICPADCCCKDPTVQEFVKEGKRFYQEMIISAAIGRIKSALTAGEKVLAIHRELNISWGDRALVHVHLYRIAISSPKMKAVALGHLEASLKVYRITAPFSEQTRMYEELLQEQPADLPSALLVKDQLSAVMARFSSLLHDE